MSALVKLLILLPSSFFLYLLIKFLYEYWWIPLRIQHIPNSQGIKGPPYKFIHGNNKELIKMRKEGLSKPMALTHDIFPRVQPHVYSWINRYGLFGQNMTPAVIASVETMLENWTGREGKKIEVFQEFRLPTSEVNSFCKLWKTAEFLGSEELAKVIRDSVMEIVKKREAKVVSGEADNFGNDFLGLLVNANRDLDEKNRLSLEDLVDECKTFYFVGHETVNSLLAWTVLLLAIHRDWQEKARREVIDIFGYQNSHHEGIAKLRTGPPTGLLRKVGREVQLGKLVLPANIYVLIANIAFYHDPQLWGDDVHLFKPERFAEGIAKATKYNAAAFFPFGLGPRSCVGMTLATTETKIAFSMILQHYTITFSPAYVHSPVPLLTLHPQHGIKVIFRSLHNDALAMQLH